MWLSDCASVDSFGKSPPPGLNEHVHTIALVNISFLMASIGVNFTVVADRHVRNPGEVKVWLMRQSMLGCGGMLNLCV